MVNQPQLKQKRSVLLRETVQQKQNLPKLKKRIVKNPVVLRNPAVLQKRKVNQKHQQTPKQAVAVSQAATVKQCRSIVISNELPFLGVGIGLRPVHYNEIFQTRPPIDFFEIISENFMVEGGRPIEVLTELLEHYPVVQHGVALYPGNAKGVDFEHLKRLKKLITLTNTPWLTEHLCWGSVDGTVSHDLLPLPYTEEAVEIVSNNLRIAQDFLEIPIAIENLSSYTEFSHSTLTEWEFISAISTSSNVGLLLDVNNIFVSSVNHGYDPYQFLEGVKDLPVFQIHIAGHSHYERFIIDTHDHPVCDEVWALYREAIKVHGNTTTLLEWDARIPSLDDTWREAEKAKQYLTPYSLDIGSRS